MRITELTGDAKERALENLRQRHYDDFDPYLTERISDDLRYLTAEKGLEVEHIWWS